MIRWILSLLAIVVTVHSSMGADESWNDLFNGRNLDGWVQHGGDAKYSVEGNVIVGTAVPNTPNSFLCTSRDYGDFVLEYEFKVDPRLNSGVQIRSEVSDEPQEVQWQNKTIKIPAKRVHGYQIEIDPDVKRGRMWTAGIYDEARRGWLYPGQFGGNEQEFSEQGRKLFKPNDWNKVRVEAVGHSIKTWLNGKPCAEITDSMTPTGFIALQVHNIGSKDLEGAQVKWRDLHIRDVHAGDIPNTVTSDEIAAGWKLLWDGKTTDGWRGANSEDFPSEGWEIKDGVLSVLETGGAESRAGGDIITRDRYSDFELLVDFKITEGANSGIKYFVQPNLDPITGTGAKAAQGSAIGLEYQILDDARHPDAKLGRDGNRTVASLYDLLTASADKVVNPIGSWNTARIVSLGNHVEHWLNGKLVLQYNRATPVFGEVVAQSKYKNIPGFGEWQDGHILLQDHGNSVSFRSIKIKASPSN